MLRDGGLLHPSSLIGSSDVDTHAIGPNGWFSSQGKSSASLRRALVASGALRTLPADIAVEISAIYADPLHNRAFAFLEAALGSSGALIAHRALRSVSAGVVGCGGIGSSVAYLLAGIGVRRFVLIDPDVVEEGNLSRQVLYTLKDVGSAKVVALSKALDSRFRDMRVVALQTSALDGESLEVLSGCDLVVCAGDDPPTLGDELRRKIARHIPLWACGYTLGRSIVRSPVATMSSSRAKRVHWESVPGGFAPSIGFQNMEIAAACVWQIVKFLSCAKPGRERPRNHTYFHDYISQ